MWKFPFIVGAAVCLSTGQTQAETIQVLNPESPWQLSYSINDVGQNSVGRRKGINLGLGIENVIPSAYDDGTNIPTTGTATQAGVEIPFSFTGNTLLPNSMGAGIPYTEATKHLTGVWKVKLQNGPDTLEFDMPSICDSSADSNCGYALLPNRATDVKISTSTGVTTPTFTWKTEGVVDRLSVSVYDLNKVLDNGQADRLKSYGLDNTVRSFTFPDGVLKEGGKYAFRVDTRRVRDSSENYFGNSMEGSALAQTISFYDFTTGTLPDVPDLWLPVDITTNPDGNPVFNFDNAVVAEDVQYYDPVVAIGYDYLTGESDPNFASFILPEIGDSLFDVFLFDGSDWKFEAQVAAADEYFFGGLGVNRFRILGIETTAGLDPNNPTAFATGLSFVSEGRFTGSMTPISQEVAAVPLSSSGPMLLGGFGLLAWLRRRKRAIAA